MPRVEIPLIGPHYTNREKKLSAQTAINMWPEINQEARNVVCLHNTAGLKTFANLEGADRGVHEFRNRLYTVNGQSLYTIDADGNNTKLGIIGGTGRCVMADDGQQLIIVTGDTTYRYTTSGGVEAITDPDLTKPTSVAYLNSQFVFDNNAGTTGEFVTSSIEAGLSIDALDFAVAESHPDDIIRVISWRQLIYFFGSHSIEPWQNTGVGNPPFARLNSGVQPYGLAGTHAICKTNEYMYFLDNKRIPRRSNGLDFPAIGNPSLGVEFAKYSKIDDCIAFEFVQDNQQFVAFTFPTADKTWCFHEQSGSWFQLSYGIKGGRHRASSMINIYGLNYAADHTNGKIYEYSLDIYDDDGEAIIKQRDTAVIHGGLYDVPGKKLFFDEVEFVIASGKTEVAGLGSVPLQEEGVKGLCASTADLEQGDLLGVVELMSTYTAIGTFPVISNPSDDGISFNNTKVVSFTFFFTKISEPGAGAPANIMSFYNITDDHEGFGIYMDDNGYIVIQAKNAAGTTILDASISNSGASFADGELHGFAGVIDLSDESRREIFHNGTDITSSVTWTTYTDDTIDLEDVQPTHVMQYNFGKAPKGSSRTFNTPEPTNPTGDADQGLGFCTFDDSCSLVSGAVWDSNGNVRDPQKWSGWYASQPQVFYGPSFFRNTGKTEPATYLANDTELSWEAYYQNGDLGFFAVGTAGRQVNNGFGSNIEAVGGDGIVRPSPGTTEQVELVSPFWENTGNWINISNLTQDTFSNVFGVEVDGADINSTYTVNKAMLVNTSDAGNRMRIEDSFVCANAAIYVCEQDGTIVDSMTYFGVASGDSVLIPTGSDYYVVVVSDTGQAKVSKWDVTPNTETVDVTGSTPWRAFASGYEFGELDRVSTSNYRIPAGGISFRFTVPNTTSAIRVGFSTTELNGTPYGNIQHSISETVGDYTGLVNNSGRSDSFSCGINVAGTDASLVPGQTYFWNLEYASGAGIVFLNHSYLEV